jgi:hypothetical protein
MKTRTFESLLTCTWGLQTPREVTDPCGWAAYLAKKKNEKKYYYFDYN